MRRTANSSVVLLAFIAGCSGGGGGGSGGGSSVAPLSSSATATPTSSTTTTPSPPANLAGTWDVSGTDPSYGDFHGTAVVSATSQGLAVKRLVAFTKKLGDGRELLHAWSGTATLTSAGLDVATQLRKADIYLSVGSLVRTAADQQPVALKLSLLRSGSTLASAHETWTYSLASPPLFPATDRRSLPLHAIDSTIRQLSFATYASYHALPDLVPYVNRPEFQAAQHFVAVDHTAKDFYRQRGRTGVVVLDKVLDDISIAEETPRADAFSLRLCDKARHFDDDVKNIHMLPCGMIAAVESKTGQHWVSGDGGLWQGCYVESQAFRYLVTQDPDALANVRKATGALCTMVEISPDKTQFARAIDQNPPANANFTAGTGAFANLSWLKDGNNDMLHGIDVGFVGAEMVLPAGDPLRARIGAAARSLLDNVSIAQSGTHEILLSYVAWKTTGDPALEQRYRDALGFKNLHIQAWLSLGDGIVQEQGISDWSGHHLAECDLISFGLLGGSQPSADERAWRDAAASGARQGFANLQMAREGLLAVAAAVSGAPGATDTAKDVLDEIPWPKPSGVDAKIDFRVSAGFCLSPYPNDPWKLDWLTNTGREQGIEGMGTYFTKGASDCYWKDGPLDFTGWVDGYTWPAQDFLHAYWLARLRGVIGPND